VVPPRLGAISALTYYTLALRPWLLRWGTTGEEASTPLPGDDLVPEAAYVTSTVLAAQLISARAATRLGNGACTFMAFPASPGRLAGPACAG
jgi:hypothetical protein